MHAESSLSWSHGNNRSIKFHRQFSRFLSRSPQSWNDLIYFNQCILCLQEISMSNSPIRKFQKGAFLGLHLLRRLILYNCDIHVMPPLNPVKYTLELLSLPVNNLVYIETSYFCGFRRLETLKLSYNHLLVIPDMSPLASTLTRFDIAHNSVLSFKPFLLNATFAELGDIDVSQNNISELTPVMILQWPRLRSLDIEENLLETLSDLSRITRGFILKVMTGNQVIRKYVHTCNLTSYEWVNQFHPNHKSHISSQYIDKVWYDISSVDVMKRWFHYFRLNIQIYLYGNVWHCDVQLSWIIRGSFPERSNTIFDNGNIRLLGSKAVTCAAPSVLKGVKLSDLGELCRDCKSQCRWQTLESNRVQFHDIDHLSMEVYTRSKDVAITTPYRELYFPHSNHIEALSSLVSMLFVISLVLNIVISDFMVLIGRSPVIGSRVDLIPRGLISAHTGSWESKQLK